MTQLVVDEVYRKRTSYPMVVNFQNAYITDAFQDMECWLYNNEENNKKAVLTQFDDIIYTGEEDEEPLGRTLLAVRDRTTGKVRIIEPGLVELKPVVKSNVNASQLLETSNLELSRKFGSKKAKQQMEHREKLKMNVETVTKQVEKTKENVSIEQLDISSYENATKTDDFYIPAINRGATCVEDVYNVDKIISDEDIEKITSEMQNKDIDGEILPCIKSIIDKNPTNIQKVFGLYASCLAKFFKLTLQVINKKNYYVCETSNTLNKIIINNFTTSIKDRRGRPVEYKDKAFCHFVVLLLLMNNYKLPIDILCEAFKITPKTILTKVSVTGATVANQGGKKILQLKLPLLVKGIQKRRR